MAKGCEVRAARGLRAWGGECGGERAGGPGTAATTRFPSCQIGVIRAPYSEPGAVEKRRRQVRSRLSRSS